MSLKKLAQDALFAQDACNLTGVVYSWAKVTVQLKEMFPDLTQAELNEHPINVLYSNKLADLSNVPYEETRDDDCSVQQVVKCWSLAVADLRSMNPGHGTDQINKHAVNQMFAAKLARLTGGNSFIQFGKAYDQCKVWSNASE